jgi:hypothetical protein
VALKAMFGQQRPDLHLEEFFRPGGIRCIRAA